MTRRWIVAVALGLMTLGSLAGLMAQKSSIPASTQVRLDAHRTLGTPHTFRNLTLWPVYDRAARATNRYTTLDEGLRTRVVRVQEASNGGDVNTLYVTNLGNKPLYLMAGEVVLGGQQDRCLGQDQLVSAGAKHVPVTVFCVEHGRWEGRADFVDSAPALAGADIRLKAQETEFLAMREAAQTAAPRIQGRLGQSRSGAIGGVAQVSASTPAAVAASNRLSEGQEKVWQRVAAKNMLFGTESATGTYRNTLTLAGGDAKRSVPAYIQALAGSLARDPHLVGVVACINGKVMAADLFSDPTLFRKLWPKLLRAYAADAVENSLARGQKTLRVTPEQVKTFYAAATDAKTRTENRSALSAMVRLESGEATAYRLMATKPVAGGGVPSLLHETVLHK